MSKMKMAALAAVTLGSWFVGTGAMAQEMREDVPTAQRSATESADQANAESQPAQGNEAVLAAPGAEPRAYPVCSRSVHDECVNPREAGRGYGNRPLGYWPGRPASEMRR
jgi:hypothetical protein